MKRETIIYMSDFHVPFQDDQAISCVLNFCKFIKPKIVVISELIDFYSISSFDKDCNRILSIEEDVKKTKELLAKIRNACKSSKIIMLESNHDNRLKRYLNKNAVELTSLSNLKFVNLLELKKFGIHYRKDFKYKDLYFKHGDTVCSKSGSTALKELEKVGKSGISGHTHRLGVVYKKNVDSTIVWAEAGCLCKLECEYELNINWQQGIAVAQYYSGTNRYYVTVIPIIRGKLAWGQHIFSGR